MSIKVYKFELEICEGNDEFWEDINSRGVTGCDEVFDLVKSCLHDVGIYVNDGGNDTLTLVKFEIDKL